MSGLTRVKGHSNWQKLPLLTSQGKRRRDETTLTHIALDPRVISDSEAIRRKQNISLSEHVARVLRFMNFVVDIHADPLVLAHPNGITDEISLPFALPIVPSPDVRVVSGEILLETPSTT